LRIQIPPARLIACLLALAGLAPLAANARADQYSPPAGYYGGATGTGATLRSQLRSAMSAGHIQRTYGDFRYSAAVTDADPDRPGNILLVYDRQSVPGAWSTSPLVWNREHVWPQSLQPGSASSDRDGNLGDPHALRPADPGVNSNRGSLPLGMASTTGGHRAVGDYYFPGDADKGDVARQLFYSDVRYETTGIELVDGLPGSNQMGDLASLVTWHFLDVPDPFERRRNHAVFSSELNPTYYTNNRNAFVDHPEFVWSVFVDQQNDSRLWVGNLPGAAGQSHLEIDLGSVLVGAAVPAAQQVTVSKAGFDGTYYAVSTTGEVAVSPTGPFHAFPINSTGTDQTQLTVGLSTSTATAGARSGRVTIDNLDVTTAGGSGRGANDADDWIDVTLRVLDHAQPSFVAETSTHTLHYDFGTWTTGSSPPRFEFDLFNRSATASFTADLLLPSIEVSGDAGTLTSDLAPLVAGAAIPAGGSKRFWAQLDTSQPGSFSATYTLATSDEDLPGAIDTGPLTLMLSAMVEQAVAPTADFDQSAVVDGADLLLWQRGAGITSGASLSDGDANADERVDAVDFGIWSTQFAAGPPASGPATLSIPEPATLSLALLLTTAQSRYLCPRTSRKNSRRRGAGGGTLAVPWSIVLAARRTRLLGC
jgi:endonuclease I